MNHVPFPNNFDAYFQKAMHEMAEGNIEQTIGFIRKALNSRMDEELFQLCLTLMKESDQTKAALDLVKQHKAPLFESTEVTQLDLNFITLLIDSGDLAEAKKQINQRSLHLKNNPEHAHLDMLLEQYLEQVEEGAAQQKQAKITEIITDSFTIAGKPCYAQMRFLASLDILPESDLLKVSQRLLREIGLHPLLKTEIITLLLNKGIEEPVEIYKQDKTMVIPLHSLKLPDETQFFLDSSRVIQNLDHLNEGEKQRLQELLFLHVLFYYPFETVAFRTPKLWVEAVLFPEGNSEAVPFVREAEKGLDLLT